MAKNNSKGHNSGKGGGAPDPATVRSIIRGILSSGGIGPVDAQQIKQETNAAARVRYAPLQQEQEASLRAAKLQTKRNTGYYKQYQAQIDQLGQNTAGIYTDANAQLAAAAGAAGQQDTAMLGALDASRQANASQFGAAPSAAANPLAAAQAVRGTDAFNNQARVIGQGASQKAYLGDQGRIAGASKLQQIIDNQARQQSVRQQMEDLAREKGAFKVDYMKDERAAQQAFLTDLLTGPNQMKYLKAQQKGSMKQQNDDQAFAGQENAKDRAAAAANASNSSSSSSGNGKGQGRGEDGRKQHQENKADAKDARAILQANPPPPGTVSAGQIASHLIEEGIDPQVAKRIAQAWIRRHANVGDSVGAAGSAATGAANSGGKGHH